MEHCVPIRNAHGLLWYGFGEMAWKRPVWDKGQSVNRWIDTFGQDEVLWDVGANVGVYTLYAAKAGHRVVSFEPEAGSFYVLQKNLDLNGLHPRVIALNVAISSVDMVRPFQLKNGMVATAQHKVTDAPEGLYRQVMCQTAARLLDTLPHPNHIKVDVDGAELATVTGLTMALREARSACIELRENGDAGKVESHLADLGYSVESEEAAITPGVRDVVFTRAPGAKPKD